MQELKTKYVIKILPNGSQCLSANTGMVETLEHDSNVIELNHTNSYDDNNNHFLDDDYILKNNINYSNTPFPINSPNLRHCPISYENNLDKLCNMVHIAAH